jgi:hypothetical protein
VLWAQGMVGSVEKQKQSAYITGLAGLLVLSCTFLIRGILLVPGS